MALLQEVFHGPFVVRSRELIEEAFAAVARGLEGPLDAALKAAAAAELPAEPAGCIITRIWPMEGWDGGAAAVAAATGVGLAGGDGAGAGAGTSVGAGVGVGRAGSGVAGAGSGAGVGEDGVAGVAGKGGGAARGYRQQVAAMQRRFDDDLRGILQVREGRCGGRVRIGERREGGRDGVWAGAGAGVGACGC